MRAWFARHLPHRRRRRRVPDPWKRFRFGLIGLTAVLALGSLGYVLLGLGAFDALYQTAITITTVGYGEVGLDPDTDINPDAYRVYTLVLVLVGASTAVYTVSVLLESVVEGSLNDGLRTRRMSRQIDHLEGHIIVVGWGRVGRSISRYATRHGADVVVVDQHEIDTEGLPYVIGDAHEDDTLIDAGIERAGTLIAALDTDSGNLALTLTARSLRPDLFLVARTAKQTSEKKFFQAGADRVVNPHEIGGSRMGALAMHAAVAEFLDEVLHDDDHDVRIVEVPVGVDSPAIGDELGDVAPREGGALVLAVRQADGRYTSNPPPSEQIGAGDTLIALGSEVQLATLRKKVGKPKALLWRGREYDA